MSQQHWDSLHERFIAADACHGRAEDGVYSLVGIKLDHDRIEGYLGTVRRQDGNYRFYADVATHPEDAERWFPALCDLFAQAGASLPNRLRDSEQFNPIEQWISFLWRTVPDKFETYDDRGVSLAHPFNTSREAIERSEMLNTIPVDADKHTPQKPGRVGETPKRLTVNARMLVALQAEGVDCNGWTCGEWASFIGCSTAAITKTQTWKRLRGFRETAKARKANDRRGRGLNR